MKVKLLAVILMFPLLSAGAKHLHSEKEYQTYWCNKNGGEMEYILDDKTRVDCLLPNYAVEFDFAQKWAECIGQAMYYGKKTNRTPVCVLIMENEYSDVRYLKRLQFTVDDSLKIYTLKPDIFIN